ncbi:MAG: hypothetical protein H7A26_03035 [Spirochaetales bacterium]|nr:hypothetical protein [Spirochaetales bacterium]
MKWWENLCNKCGICCLKKKVIDGNCIIDKNSPCQYLDIESNRCLVYEKRFILCRECRKMTIFHALFSSYLPDDCGYVVFFRKGGFLKIFTKILTKYREEG